MKTLNIFIKLIAPLSIIAGFLLINGYISKLELPAPIYLETLTLASLSFFVLLLHIIIIFNSDDIILLTMTLEKTTSNTPTIIKGSTNTNSRRLSEKISLKLMQTIEETTKCTTSLTITLILSSSIALYSIISKNFDFFSPSFTLFFSIAIILLKEETKEIFGSFRKTIYILLIFPLSYFNFLSQDPINALSISILEGIALLITLNILAIKTYKKTSPNTKPHILALAAPYLIFLGLLLVVHLKSDHINNLNLLINLFLFLLFIAYISDLAGIFINTITRIINSDNPLFTTIRLQFDTLILTIIGILILYISLIMMPTNLKRTLLYYIGLSGKPGITYFLQTKNQNSNINITGEIVWTSSTGIYLCNKSGVTFIPHRNINYLKLYKPHDKQSNINQEKNKPNQNTCVLFESP